MKRAVHIRLLLLGISFAFLIFGPVGIALAQTPGTLKWVFDARDDVNSSPAIGADGTIYIIVSKRNKLYAIKPDGSLKWEFHFPYSLGGFPSSPTLGSDGTIYVGSLSRYRSIPKGLYAINSNGTLKWFFEMEVPATTIGIDSSPAIGADGTIYVGTTGPVRPSGGKLYAIKPDGTFKRMFPPWF